MQLFGKLGLSGVSDTQKLVTAFIRRWFEFA